MFDFLSYSPISSHMPKPGPVAYLRVLDLSPNPKRMDVYSNDYLIAKNLGFGKFTQYIKVPPGPHNIRTYKAKSHGAPILDKVINLEPSSIWTLAIIDSQVLFTVPDPEADLYPDAANVRFIHLSGGLPLIDITMPDGNMVIPGLEYGAIPGYLTLISGRYTFHVKPSQSQAPVLIIPDVILKPDWNCTVYVVGLVEHKPELKSIILLDGSTYIDI